MYIDVFALFTKYSYKLNIKTYVHYTVEQLDHY